MLQYVRRYIESVSGHMPTYPLAKPHIGKEEKRAVLAVLDSGILSLGPKQKEFETKFAKYIGTKYACAVSSGTAGLHIALLAAGIGHGDEVITSPFSFIASANAILYVGAKPVFVDIDPVSYNMNPALLASKITKRTKAILVVHIFGQPCDMTPILTIARKRKLKIIEDACESIGATNRGKAAGTFGESAVFAFYPNKQMTTGEGGTVVSNRKSVYEFCKSVRNQGRAENMQWLDHVRLGYNYRMDEMSAALGLVQLGKLDGMIRKRRMIARWYKKYLAPWRHLIRPPVVAPGNTHTWFVYVVQVLGRAGQRDACIRALAEKGIQSKPYLPAIHLFDFYRKKFGFRRGDFPVTEAVSDRSLSLPFSIGLRERDVQFIVRTLVAFFETHGQRIQK